jgi:RHS repeat-associated protein
MQEISCYIVHNHSVNRINVSLKPLHRHRRRNVSLGACVHKKNKHLALTGTQTNATLGESYLYADGSLPSWALLGEYGNGGVSSTGRTEYIWLPTQDGSAIPVGLYRSGKLHAIHTDHLGTPRLIANETNTPQWQWPYSAFGDNAPTGILKPTTSAASAFTSVPATQGSGTATTATATLLATSAPTQVNNLRFPGQYADSETGLFYNYFRTYQPNQGRYTQNDPIGLAGGLNRFGYVGGNPLFLSDPTGLDPWCRDRNLNLNMPAPRGQGGGCGDAKTDKIVPDLFPEACRSHDICYANPGPTRGQCDRQFLRDMYTESMGRTVITPMLYYIGVVVGGRGAFDNARAPSALPPARERR